MFVHLGPATWQGREYDNHSTPLDRINPKQLDTEQWCRAAKLWGAKQIIFVAKHTGGFCWWQTRTTEYGIRNTPWKNGKGDVLAELAASCRRNGLNLGVYVYPGDDTWGATMGSGGRTKDPARQEGYNKVFRQQLTEVLTNYGPIKEVWFDGSCVIEVSDILREHASEAVIFQGPMASIRWPGNEKGMLPDPAWNSLSSKALKTGSATVAQGDPDGDAWAPLEADTPLYNHQWFWSAQNEKKRKSLKELMEVFYKSVGRGGVLLLNSSPDTEGRIPEGDMKLYEAFGKEIERRFATPVAEVADRKGRVTELSLPGLTSVNHVILMEDYTQGERIRGYVVEGRGANGTWSRLSGGVSVGRKKIDAFPPRRVSAVRLRVTEAAAEPLVRRLAVFSVEGVSLGSMTASHPTTASAIHSARYGAALATDGDPATRWATPDGTKACWLEVDLEEPMQIGGTVIRELVGRVARFRLLSRNGNSEPWTTRHEGTRIGGDFRTAFPSFSGRFIRLEILDASDAPTITEFDLLPGEEEWKVCGRWDPKCVVNGKVELALDLSPYITAPAQYELKIVPAKEGERIRIDRTTLLYEGEEATPGMLTRLDETGDFNINRTAQVTAETRSALRIAFTPESPAGTKGEVRIRPKP